MAAMKRYSSASQTVGVIAHKELFWARSTIEETRSLFFSMNENVSAKKVGSATAKDLTVSVNVTSSSSVSFLPTLN